MEPIRKAPLIKVTSHGIETARYNSLVRYEVGGKEYALYANGNRLVALDIETEETVVDSKVVNEAIMVITECHRSSHLLICTYDGRPPLTNLQLTL